MQHPVVRLIEAVRALRTYRSPSGDDTVVRFACGAGEFPSRVTEIHDALEAVDSSSALSVVDDIDKMKRGLDAAVRWVSVNGGNVKDFEQTILAAISEKPKKPKGFILTPSLTPKKVRRRWRPATFRRIDRMRAMRKVDDLIGLKDDIQAIGETLGDVAPANEAAAPSIR